jgi:hypothetical protein
VDVDTSLFTNNGGYDINVNAAISAGTIVIVNNNKYYLPTSGHINGSVLVGPVTDSALSGSPYVGAPNYYLNNTAGAGAACQYSGAPNTFPSGNTANYPSIGASQYKASGGGSSISSGTPITNPGWQYIDSGG